jgi:hypothetical protein
MDAEPEVWNLAGHRGLLMVMTGFLPGCDHAKVAPESEASAVVWRSADRRIDFRALRNASWD